MTGRIIYPMKQMGIIRHHFAAIAGAGPLVGPVLAAQFGFMPGFYGCLSRSNGRSCPRLRDTYCNQSSTWEIACCNAKEEINKVSGVTTTFAIILILVVAMAA